MPNLQSVEKIRFVLIDQLHTNLLCTVLAQRVTGVDESQGGR